MLGKILCFCLVVQGQNTNESAERRSFRGARSYTYPPQTVSERQGGPIPDYAPYPSASGNGAQTYNPYVLSQPWNPYSFQPLQSVEHPPDSQYSVPSSNKGNSQSHHTGWPPAPPAGQAQWPSGSLMSVAWSSPTQPPAQSGYNPWASAPPAASSHSYPPPSTTFPPHPSSYPPPTQTFSPPPPTYSPKYPPRKPSKIPESCLYCPASASFKGYEQIYDVRDVSAANIDVVAGIGGSFLAGTALDEDSEIGYGWWMDTQDRSFALGGLKSCLQYLTFANLLETLNPNLRGVYFDERNAGYLFAFGPFADTSNEAPLTLDPNDPERTLVSEADQLVDRMEMDSQISPEQWKLVFVMPKEYYICRACALSEADIEIDLEAFETDFKKSIDRLLSLENVIVVVVQFPDLGKISGAPGFSQCDMVDLDFACPCVGEADFPENVQMYAVKVEHAVNSYRTKLLHRQDASIILVDPWKDAINMFADTDLLAPNCFNWGEDLTATAAALLWNSVWRSYNAYNRQVDVGNLDGANIISGKNSENLRLVCPTGPLLSNHRN